MDIIRLDGLSSELSDRADSADSTAVIRSILVHWVSAVLREITWYSYRRCWYRGDKDKISSWTGIIRSCMTHENRPVVHGRMYSGK